MANIMYRLVGLLFATWLVEATVVPTTTKNFAYPTKAPPGAPKCGLNEVFSECGANGCQNTCQNPKLSMVCKAICTPGCVCAEGYIRNSKGACVLIKNCDCTGLNEIFSECDNHGCRNTCKEPDLLARCSYVAGCYPGCICKPGFLKDESGICVPQSKCYTCKANEIFKDCGSFACESTCEIPNKQQICDPLPNTCDPGCFCTQGYVRNEIGECVLPKNCPKKCTGLNEVFSQCENNICQNSCQNPQKSLTCKGSCTPGCVCAEGYLRNSKGVCVLIKDCDCKKDNEIFKECGPACVNTCEEPDLLTRIACAAVCVPGCFCKPTFLKNNNGDCIPQSKCYKCTGPNEMFSECGNNSCQKNCDTYDRKDIACRPSCNPGCICKDGYIRNQQGVCVTPDQCENRKCKGKNEFFSTCVSPCGERCSNLGQDIVCNFLVCNAGCDCKPGFFRNSKNECVPPAECDCNPNEELDMCYNKCPPRTCDAIGKMFKCAAPDPNNCKPACKCKFNYRRNSDGVCVPIEKCPPLTCTGDNEIYKACPPSCLDESCRSLYDPLMCTLEVRECAPACVCKDGYLRNAEGKCILKTQCPEYCSDPNAIFEQCGNVCPVTCKNKDIPNRVCPKICKVGGGCICKPGFVENYKGVCIPPEKCPKCGPNEVFACGSACDTTCATLGEKCPIVNIQCTEKCYCVDGYARNAQNVCVPIKECPPKMSCGKNQKYNACPPNCPPEETCESYLSGIAFACAPNGAETRVCTPRCECLPGFVRKSPNGDCIKPDRCCSDPNEEVVSCPNPCPGGTCEAPAFANCKAPCKIRGCQCKNGYVKDKTGKCILLSQCRPTCGPYEIYVDDSPYVQETCATLGKPVVKGSKPGCICVDGYVRDVINGKCIKKTACKPYRK
ncbi:zonadhesin-like [Arctopsyche grandis]|uniref:zonadhesin-like n=1 Tax=Arctopsyche grandis TaxID=121162 RepID=UPI00406D8BBC